MTAADFRPGAWRAGVLEIMFTVRIWEWVTHVCVAVMSVLIALHYLGVGAVEGKHVVIPVVTWAVWTGMMLLLWFIWNGIPALYEWFMDAVRRSWD